MGEIWSKHRNGLVKGNENEKVQIEVRKVLGKFHNIHFSHPTTLPADVRIIGENKIC